MRCKLKLQTALLCLGAWCLLNPISLHAQTNFEKNLQTKIESMCAAAGTAWPELPAASQQLYPNDALQSVMSPTGWGGSGTYVFGSIGGIYPEVYKQNKGDLITSAGVCTGSSEKAVNVAVSINMTDVHRLRDFSENFFISRMLGHGSSITVAALQMFANAQQSDAPGSTFYIAFSHAVQTLLSKTSGCSKLSYSIGIGTGRFLYKSPKDIEAGHGKYGTAVFGNISYEILQHVNLNAEWSGMNLGFSLGWRPFVKSPLSIGAGVTNLTRFSADKPSAILSIGYPLSIKR